MSLASRLGDLATAVATDVKLLRTYISGSSTGDLSGLNTTTKVSLVAAINEAATTGGAGSPPNASEATAGVAQVATTAEVTAGTIDTDMVTPLKLQQKLTAFAQPLDSDLTAIAALTTTTYGRALLALADVNALKALLPTPTDTVSGIARNATQVEVTAGTNDATIMTPLKHHVDLVAYAQPLDSDLTSIAALTTTTYGRAFLALVNQAGLQALLGLSTDGTFAGNSDTLIPTQKSVKTYADGLLDANNAYQYKGVVDASTNPNYPAASAGWTYKISVAGIIGGASGLPVEIGDSITCIVDGTASGNQATVGANWIVMQTNIAGAVVGPASTAASDLVTFSGTTGKVVADSGVSISTDGTLATNNNTKVPTEGAIRTYLAVTFYTQTQLGNYDTDLAAAYAAAKV